MLTLDGSHGEGGGQILRTALTLSLITDIPFHITHIRAGRKRPGLLRQHLTAVEAAAVVGRAAVEGANLGSTEITFRSGPVRHGEYHFAVGTAGSATLVVQTLLPALLTVPGSSSITVEGGTHNPAAPPYEFLERTFLPVLSRMGPRLEATLHRPGFYPAGGGSLTVKVESPRSLRPLDLTERGAIQAVRVEAAVAGLPRHIAQREIRTIRDALQVPADSAAVRGLSEAPGPGNVVVISVESENLTEVFTGFGRRGKPAEVVGHEVAQEANRYLRSGVPVGEHLADQLLIPLALVGGRFRTLPLSRHATTNLWVIRQFLPTPIETRELSPEVWEVAVTSARKAS